MHVALSVQHYSRWFVVAWRLIGTRATDSSDQFEPQRPSDHAGGTLKSGEGDVTVLWIE